MRWRYYWEVVQRFLAVFFALFWLSTGSYGVVVVTGDIATGSGVVTVTEDIVFNVTARGNVNVIAFDDWTATSDSDWNYPPLNPASFTIVLNGVEIVAPFASFTDNRYSDIHDLKANDTYFAFHTPGTRGIAVTAGDTFVFKAGSWSVSATPTFNPAVSGVFDGNAFLVDYSGRRVSDFVQVPEPSTPLLLLLGALMCFLRRRVLR